MKSVNIFHPATQHSYQLALAIQKAGLLNQFITSVYFKKDKFPYSFLNHLPDFFKIPIQREFKKRFLAGLDDNLIHQYPWFESVRQLFERVKTPPILRDWMVQVCDRAMDGYVSRRKLGDISTIVGFSGSCLETFQAAKRRGIQCVLDQPIAYIDYAREVLKEEANLHPDFAGTINYGFQSERWCENRREEIELSDAILCGSSFVKNSLAESGFSTQKAFIISYGVDLKRFSCAESKSKLSSLFRIIFVGAIGQRKGIKYLLEAVKQLKLKDLKLILIGNFVGSREPYRIYSEYFEHISHVPRAEMQNHYKTADLLVLPSVAEGFGLVVLEAMASGLPVIVSENTGGRDVVEDGEDGFVVPIRDIGAIREEIAYLYENRTLCREMGMKARQKAERFSWERYQTQIKNFFEGF